MKYVDRQAGDAARTPRGRNGWVDCAKAIGIALVVFGHTWRGLGNAKILATGEMFRFVDRWVYSFHMPLFFFVSGLFVVRSARKGAGQFFREKSLALLYPFVVWTVLLQATQSLLGGHVNHPVSLAGLPSALLLEPVFWFLPTMFMAVAVAFALVRARLGAAGLVAAFVALWAWWAAEGTVSWTPLYFLCENGLYLAIGAAAAPWLAGPLPAWSRRPVVAAAVCPVLALAVLGCVFARWDRSPWLGVVPACAGLAMVLLIAVQLERPRIGWLRRLGELSLPVYVASTFAMAGARIVMQKVLHVSEPVTHVLVGTVAGLAFPVALVAIAVRVRADVLLFGSRCDSRPAEAGVPRPVPPVTIEQGLAPAPALQLRFSRRVLAAARRKPPTSNKRPKWQPTSTTTTTPS